MSVHVDNTLIMPVDHWTRGGTGITNFGKEERPIYEEAIRRHGDPKITIHDEPMQRGTRIDKQLIEDDHSLRREGGFRDLSEFWEAYRAVQKEFETGDTQQTFHGQGKAAPSRVPIG